MINTMETSQALEIESFSYSWLTNRRISFDSPSTEPLRKSIEETQNFNFDVPISKSPAALVHADEIFCDGYILPKHGDWSKKELFKFNTSNSIPSIPILITSPADRNHSQLLKKWGKSSKRIFQKYIRFLRPLCGKAGCPRTRSSVRVDDIDGKAVLGVESCNGSPQPSLQGSANSEKNWRKSTAAIVDNRGLGKVKNWSHLSQLSPSYAPDDWSSESSIHMAILHCKQSFGVLKEEKVAPAMEGVGRENNFELGLDDTVKQEKSVAKAEEVIWPELSLAEHQKHGAKASKPDVTRPGLSLADNDNYGGEASELDILEPSTLENKILGGEASKLAKSQLELLSTHSEILGGEQKENLDVVNGEDNCLKGSEVPVMEFVLGGEASKPGEPQPELSPAHNEIHIEMIDDDDVVLEMIDDDDDVVPIEETNIESKLMENQEFLSPEVLEAVPAGNEKVIERPNYESEIIKEEALVGTEFAPAGADRPEVEGELIPISPTASQESQASEKGLESESTLLEDNEKLREMIQRMLEVGNQQLTAISSLTGRVKDLEKKLARKKKLRIRRVRAIEKNNEGLDSQFYSFFLIK